MTSRYSAIPSLWVLAMGVAFAQETPPTAPPADKPAEEEKPVRNWPKFELGYISWGIDGNERTFRRFGTPTKGLVIREFSFNTREASPASYHEFMFRGIPNGDRVLEVSGIFGPRASSYAFSAANDEFYEASPFVIDSSRRMQVEGSVRHNLGNGFDVVADFSRNQLDKVYEGPEYSKHQRTNRFNTRVAGAVGSGRLDLSFAEKLFYDRANFQPDSHSQTWRSALDYPFGPVQLQGSYAQTNIEQSGRNDSKVRTYTLDGGIPLSPDFDLQFGMRAQKFDMPEVINAYVRERTTSWGRIVGRLRDVSTQLSYRRVDTERVREDHRYVDAPKFNTFEGRFSGKLGGGLRWSLKGSIEALEGDAIMLTDDPRRLFWDDRTNLQLKIDHGGENWNGYFVVNQRFMQNSPRDVEVRSRQFVLGGNLQVRPTLDIFAEYTHDRATTDFREDDATIGLEDFFPSSTVTSFGANWLISDETSLSASYTRLATDNDNPIFERDGNVLSRFLTAHLRHRTANGNEFGLLFAPGKYEDKVIRQLGYETKVVMVTARFRF